MNDLQQIFSTYEMLDDVSFSLVTKKIFKKDYVR